MTLKIKLNQLAVVFVLSVICINIYAAEKVEPIWHCSKMPNGVAESNDSQKTFSMISAHGTIGVSLDDLLSAYSGYPVRIGGKQLFACFMAGQEDLSISALNTLGLSAPAMQMLARRSAIVQRNLKLVTDEQEMQSCIESHEPAFGYMSVEVVSEKVAPCF